MDFAESRLLPNRFDLHDKPGQAGISLQVHHAIRIAGPQQVVDDDSYASGQRSVSILQGTVARHNEE
jgi:hypothetical protein